MMPHSRLLQQHLQAALSRLPQETDRQHVSEQAQAVLAFSDFVCDSLVAHPAWLQELERSPTEADEWQHYAAWLHHELQDVRDEAALMKALRLFRRRMMVRIAWAQTLQLVPTESSLQQLSTLAETLIIAARDWLYAACCREWGTPSNSQGVAQPLMILGMGKLGGGELNFSSDIDLIFAWPENGSTVGEGVNLITPSSLPAWGKSLSKCWISRHRMVLSIVWICACVPLATAARWL